MSTQPHVETLAKNLTTPFGEADWCKVFRPDTKFNPEGVYEAAVLVDTLESDTLSAFIAQIDAYAAEWQKKCKKKVGSLPYSDHIDKEGNDTGKIKIKAKLKATGKYGPRRPAVYDSAGKQLTTPVDIGNGSSVRLRVNVKGFNTGAAVGVTLELVALQIKELVVFSSGDSGFDAVDGSYVSENQGGFDGAEGTEESADY